MTAAQDMYVDLMHVLYIAAGGGGGDNYEVW